MIINDIFGETWNFMTVTNACTETVNANFFVCCSSGDKLVCLGCNFSLEGVYK